MKKLIGMICSIALLSVLAACGNKTTDDLGKTTTKDLSNYSHPEIVEYLEGEGFEFSYEVYEETFTTTYVYVNNKNNAIAFQKIDNPIIGVQYKWKNGDINEEWADIWSTYENDSMEKQRQYDAYEKWLSAEGITTNQLVGAMDYYETISKSGSADNTSSNGNSAAPSQVTETAATLASSLTSLCNNNGVPIDLQETETRLNSYGNYVVEYNAVYGGQIDEGKSVTYIFDEKNELHMFTIAYSGHTDEINEMLKLVEYSLQDKSLQIPVDEANQVYALFNAEQTGTLWEETINSRTYTWMDMRNNDGTPDLQSFDVTFGE